MSVWDSIVGQPRVVDQLRAVSSGDGRALAQSWLICGPPGSGRSHVARAFAAALDVGQPRVVDQLRAVSSGDGRALAQSWLICGPPGSGRSHVARAFAAALESPDHGLSETPTRVTSKAPTTGFPKRRRA